MKSKMMLSRFDNKRCVDKCKFEESFLYITYKHSLETTLCTYMYGAKSILKQGHHARNDMNIYIFMQSLVVVESLLVSLQLMTCTRRTECDHNHHHSWEV